MDGVLKFIGGIVIVSAFIVGLSLVFSFPTMWLVNYLIAPSAQMAVFGHPHMSFICALCLNILCVSLFKGSSTYKNTK